MKIPRTDATVEVRSTEPFGVPLSKERIAIYNSGLVPIERYERDRTLIAGVGAESLRIDLGWGAEWMPRRVEVVRREPDGALSFHFEQTDEIARLLTDAGVRPYWSYCYVPAAARRPGQSWMGMATDDTVWVETVRAYVAGMAARGVDVHYHEVYNEPDLRDERTGAPHFYEGDLDDYLALYRATARAIRDADPSALVGGPALAVTSVNARWLRSFLELVQRERLPLDFLSFHHYGHFSVENTIRIAQEVLAEFDGFEHLELHLNEYNSFVIDYPRGGLQDSHYLASSFAAEIPRLLGHRAITRTHWAQFMDSGNDNFSGMIDIDGIPKPVYAVYEFYQRMPLTQVRVAVDGPDGLGAIAGAEAGTTRAIVWNRSAGEVDVALATDRPGLPGSIVVLDAEGRAETPVRSGESIGLRLARGAVALVHLGETIEVVSRRCSAVLRRPFPDDDGWVDVDERTGTVSIFTGSSSAIREAVLDTTDASLASADWELSAVPPDPGTDSVTLWIEDDRGAAAHLLRGDVAPQPIAPRPRRPGTTRLSFVVDVPAGTRVTIRPDGVRE